MAFRRPAIPYVPGRRVGDGMRDFYVWTEYRPDTDEYVVTRVTVAWRGNPDGVVRAVDELDAWRVAMEYINAGRP